MQDTVSYTVHSFLLTGRGEREYNMLHVIVQISLIDEENLPDFLVFRMQILAALLQAL